MASFDFFKKRLFDLFFSFLGLLVFFPLILIAWLLASIDTKSNGFFVQKRVGRHGRLFNVYKIKTMKPILGITTTVTQKLDPRITKLGYFFRKTKIDELPQLWNVFVGDMSFVGPRPDVPGYADRLEGDEKAILEIRPGITGPATIKYRNEEALLAQQSDPEDYNMKFIWPDKVRINLDYIHNWSLVNDIKYILKTVLH
ncbi:sugar transferase [Shewanella algae]|uniref:sugar transferase n=1 Tax=Shewanella algae TaxID=38313 RepID=UPI0011B6DC08|nr:sugar transferase [Shewanella algae]TWU69670.1 sugar transferase [Shewanella algae]